MPLILRVLTYCKQPLATPMEHRFDHLGGTIGRSPDNSFVLADASKFVSRHHCRVEYSSAEGGFTLTDLGSNASHVGGVPVGNGKSRRLNHMEAVTIGDYQLQVVLEEQVASPAAFEFQATPSHHMIPEENYLGAPTPNANSLGSEFDDPLAMASILKGGGLGGDPLGLGGDPLSGGMGGQQGSFRGSESDHLPAFNMPYVAQQQAHSPAPVSAPASGGIPADFFSAPLAPASAPLQPAQPAWGAPAPAAGGAGMIPDDFDIFGGPINPPATPMGDPLGGGPLGGSPLGGNPSAGTPLGGGPIGASQHYQAPAAPVVPPHAPLAPAVTLAQPATAPAPIPATDFDPLGAPTLGASTLGSDFDPLGGLGAPAAGATLGSDFDPLGTMLGGNQSAAPLAAPRPGMRGNAMGTLPPTNTAPATLASSGGLQSNAPMTLPPSMVPPFPKTIASRAPSQEAPAALPEVVVPVTPVFEPAPVAQPAVQQPAPQAAPPRPAVAAVAAAAPAGATDSEIMAALLRGLGLPDLKTKFSDVATAELCGTMLRSAVAGTMDVLLARSMTKREIRVEATMLAQQGNNPMKFFPDPNQALTQMLTNAWAGYLPGARAMNDAFDDLKAHELATIAGMRAALAGVLERFDPAEIEKRLAVPTVMDKMMASSRKAKMWDQMVALYRTMSAEADDDFQRLFGEKFAAAYEEQTTRMRMNRK